MLFYTNKYWEIDTEVSVLPLQLLFPLCTEKSKNISFHFFRRFSPNSYHYRCPEVGTIASNVSTPILISAVSSTSESSLRNLFK